MSSKSKNTIVKTKNLSIGYTNRKDNTTIASNINIELNSGELVGLIGANGIGKSTLLRTLTKVQPKLEGKIEINNKSLKIVGENAQLAGSAGRQTRLRH